MMTRHLPTCRFHTTESSLAYRGLGRNGQKPIRSVVNGWRTLERCCKDPGLLETCARRNVDVTQMVWDITVASSRRNLVQKLTAARKQAQNPVTKAQRRALPQAELDDQALTSDEFERYLRARFHPSRNTVDRLTVAIGKYSNRPGAERGTASAHSTGPEGR